MSGYLSVDVWTRAMAMRLLPAKWALSLVAGSHYLRGEQELKRLRRLVDPGKNSVDAGAHHGAYAHFLGRFSKWVYCYEPYPLDAEFLREAFAGRNITVLPFALSEHAGVEELMVPSGPFGETGGQASLAPPRFQSGPVEKIVVQTKRLDEMGHTDVGFVKIDVEGYERSVLAGAAGLIEKERPVILVELHGYRDEDPMILFREITAPNYSGWFYFSGHPFAIEQFQLNVHATLENAGVRGRCYRQNFIFVPREKLERVGETGIGNAH